ncbi:type II toxin-antitoxin system HicA family toxin [Candidatus Enterococcus murrayae]|uniref:Type II toxin-antitoxin system HicA family toxin n=1 Tax=Candidatus Enterococcus murrayae TaxID=2815321 RepID=A0ABS3HJZ5_9ENTE|nr:type II toxin-antitoxin system HicA family toxin [Enterococcus sp. MJM16]
MPLTGKEMLNLAKKNGWQVVRINGSHHIVVKKGYLPVSIPVHSKELKVGIEQKILKDLGLK